MCDLVLLYLLPKREFYKNMKFKYTDTQVQVRPSKMSLCSLWTAEGSREVFNQSEKVIGAYFPSPRPAYISHGSRNLHLPSDYCCVHSHNVWESLWLVQIIWWKMKSVSVPPTLLSSFTSVLQQDSESVGVDTNVYYTLEANANQAQGKDRSKVSRRQSVQ